MSAVVHHQRTRCHLLFNQSCHIRIAIACRRRASRIGIPVDLLQQVTGIVLLDECCHFIGSNHMGILVTIITHHTNGVLPGTGILIVGIADSLIRQKSGLIQRPGRETSYCHIGFPQIGLCIPLALLDHLSVIKQTEEIITDITINRTERVVAFETKQEVIRIITTPLRTKHPVIPSAITEEQQITRQVTIGRCPVIKHLQITTISSSIRCTT